MKSKAYQVRVIKLDANMQNPHISYLSNNRGKTIVCMATAKKWAKQYKQRFINTSHEFGHVLIEIGEY